MIAWKKFESFCMHLIYSISISPILQCIWKNPGYLKITHERKRAIDNLPISLSILHSISILHTSLSLKGIT